MSERTGWVVVIVIFVLASIGICMSISLTEKRSAACKAHGGVPLTERGSYKACMKPDNFIIVEGLK
jgi:hypothetical protein